MTSKTLMTVLASATITLAAMPAFADNQSGDRHGKTRPSFSDMDTNGDGQVTVAEIQALAATRFAKTDTNGDGSLSKEEMIAQAKGDNARKVERRAKRMIRRLDKDGNGTIEMSEIQSTGREKRLIEKLDTDKNGSVSAAEFEARKGRRHGSKKQANDTAVE